MFDKLQDRFDDMRARLFGYNPEPICCAEVSDYGDMEVKYRINYDGDTITVDIPSFPPIIGRSVNVRVQGVDCPEMMDPRKEVHEIAVAAKDFTQKKLMGASKVTLKYMRRDKYFRILADVDFDGNDLAEALLKENLAKSYFGGKKLPW